jgi:biopolymer transport protein ExbD
MKVPSVFAGGRKPRIEMLPLIDIVFLLLVFFIYAMLSMAVHRSLPVTLPFSATSETDTELNIVVTIQKNGFVFLDKQKLEVDELGVILSEKAKNINKQQPLQVDLFADRDVSYQELYRVLDILRSSGIANVALQSDISK